MIEYAYVYKKEVYMRKLIGDKKFYKMVLTVAIPIIIQNGVTHFVNLLDNIMIGQLGTLSMSGVSITNQLLQVFNITIFGALSGPGIFMAQYYGKKDKKGLQSCFHFKLIIGLLITLFAIGLLMLYGKDFISLFLTNKNDRPGDTLATMNFAMTYLKIMLIGLFPFVISQIYASSLRETGNTFLPMVSSVSAVCINFVLNYVLIFGHFGFPCLKVTGGAIATVIARYIEMFIIVIGGHLEKHLDYLKGIYHHLAISLTMAKQMILRGLPLLCNEILWSVSMTLICQCYSTRGLAAVAAINMTNTVVNFFMIVCYAMGNSISIIVGQKLGAGKIDQARDYDLKMIAMNCVCCIIIGVCLLISAQYIPYVYKTSHQVRELATLLLSISACMMPIISLYYGSYFTLRAGGKTLLTFLFDSVYTFAISFIAAFLLTRLTQLPLFYVYLFVQCLDIPKAILGIILVNKGIWIHNLVNES